MDLYKKVTTDDPVVEIKTKYFEKSCKKRFSKFLSTYLHQELNQVMMK